MAITHTTAADSNIFVDLGFDPAKAEVMNIKSGLMVQISKYIEENQLTQAEAGRRMKVSSTRINNAVNGKTERFTIDALVMMLASADMHVELKIA